MEDILDYENQQTKGLPVFLKVLCILTFVGAGLFGLMYIYNIISFESSIKQLEMSEKILSSSKNPFGDLSGTIEATRQWGMLSYILALAGCVLCLVGALMMWKLKKIGFYTYVLGQIVPFIGSILMLNAMKGSSAFMGAVSSFGVILSAIIALAFIVMYAFNFKHLK